MQLYLGTETYTVSQSHRQATWQVNMPQERFDFLRMRKVAGPYGCCVIKGVTEDDARAWVAVNPIDNPKGWARVLEIVRHYGFLVRFRAEQLYDRIEGAFHDLRFRLGLITWEGETVSIAARLGLTRGR